MRLAERVRTSQAVAAHTGRLNKVAARAAVLGRLEARTLDPVVLAAEWGSGR